MKIFVASDIHGSAYYCKKMISCIEKEKPDKIIFLGDILYHGPRNDLPYEYNPKEVIKLLNSLNYSIVSVRGNCDSEVDQMVLNFPILADYGIIVLKNKTVFFTHGHIYNETKIPPLRKGDIVLYGHTHIQALFEKNDFIYMNCGSVSIPKENGFNGYMTIENENFYWKDLDGTIKKEYHID